MSASAKEKTIVGIRFICDYIAFGEETHLVVEGRLNEAKESGLLRDFMIFTKETGRYGMDYFVFTVDLPFNEYLTVQTSWKKCKKRAREVVNAILNDTDARVQWASPIFEEN